MSDYVTTFFLSILGGCTGFILHELTHFAIARAVGRRAWIDWRELSTYFSEGSGKGTVLIRFGPFGIGLLIMYPITVSGWSLPLVFFWVVYALGGIRNDILLTINRLFTSGRERSKHGN